MATKTNGKATAVGGELGTPSNGAAPAINLSVPYVATVRIRGVADLLFHRWNVEAVKEKADAAKGSKAKKTDNIESYVYRNDAGELCIPGEYLRGSIIGAAKFRQDPRSPRKSAQDLFKAAVVSLTTLAPVYLPGEPEEVTAGRASARSGAAGQGVEWRGMVPCVEWSYEHACRVMVQRNGVTRVRPALKAGWEAEFQLMVNIPEYCPPDVLNEVIAQAGRLIGLADFRPTYGRFSVVLFRVGLDDEEASADPRKPR